MSRIVPQENNSHQSAPKWMNTDELLKCSQKGDKPIQKTASDSSLVVIKYACDGCAKTFLADHPELKNQQRLAALKNTQAKFKCPECDGLLKVSQEVKALEGYKESRTADSFHMEKEANYSTFTDRLVVMKALDALSKFASKVGMYRADVRYQRSEHTKQAGQQNDMLNSIDCQIDWQYGRNQHARVYASVQIDPAGKILMPRVFKTSSNQEYPFDKETVANLMTDVDFKKQFERQMRKTDIPTFRKPDPTNFHMASEKVADEGGEGVEGKGEGYIEEMYGDIGKPAETPNTIADAEGKPIKIGDTVIQKEFKPGSKSYVWSNLEKYVVKEVVSPQHIVVFDKLSEKDLALNPTEVKVIKSAEDKIKSKHNPSGESDVWTNEDNKKIAEDEALNDAVNSQAPSGPNAMPKSDDDYNLNFPEPSTQSNTELLANIRSLYGDTSNTTGLTMPEANNLSESQVAMLQNIIDQHNSSVGGVSQSVNDLVQQANDILYSSKVSWDNPSSISNQPATAYAPQKPTGVVQQQLTPQQTVYNPQDSKQYTVKQQTPQATTIVDTQTNQEAVVPAGQEQYLKPVVHTTSELEDTALREHIYANNDKENSKSLEKIELKKARIKTMSPRWNEIRKSFRNTLQAGGWKGSITNGIDHFSSLAIVASITDVNGNVITDPQSIRYTLLKGHEDITVQFDDGTEKKACNLGGTIMMVDQEPIVIRASKGYNNEYNGDPSRMPREVRALQEMGFKPDKGDKDETGHSDHGVPLGETKKIDIGLTEFPAGKTRGTGKGYNIPFRKMDENQVKERENFPDRDMLPYGKQPARDIEYKGPKTNSPLDEVESSLREAVGFDVKINRPDQEGTTTKPSVVRHSPSEVTVTAPSAPASAAKPTLTKPVEPKLDMKKAPNIEEYKEPEVIPEAGGKASEAITKLRQVIQKKQEVEAALKAALKPVEETMANIRKPYESEIAKQADQMRSYIDMVYDQLTQSEDHVQAYENKIWAAVSREKATSPTASLTQVLAEADKLDKTLSEQIRKLKAIIENKDMQMVVERFLYEFPISGTQQKKIQSADEGSDGASISSLLKQFEQWIREMIPINTAVIERLLSTGV